jgi:hypothetical protein
MAKNAINWDDRKAVAKLRKMAGYLSSKELARANAAALNRAGKSAGGKHRKASASSVTAPASEVVSAFQDTRATANRPLYVIVVRGKASIALRHFARMRQTATGVAVKIWRNGKDAVMLGTFIVERFRGNAFTRRGDSRGPIKTLYGPSPRRLAEVSQGVLAEAFDKVYRARIAQEISFRITRANR